MQPQARPQLCHGLGAWSTVSWVLGLGRTLSPKQFWVTLVLSPCASG